MRSEAGAHLWDAAEAAKLVDEFVRGRTESEFSSNLLIRSATERQMEILGEALNRLRRDDAETAARVPDLEKIIGMRNIITHQYGEIDYEIVWRAATTGIPALIPILNNLVDEARGTLGL
ncbi:HepT-like ribonuclease domain-containing protein [Brevibacterium album]|uniref:HepT-like ribonuclease domain-containing protein n=1 Tax=Brevibacterium album TaxID=417948 RepID=UPI00048CC6B1|nr:HepT-like ribonuclease domain-containing protein [Brevibacterium album]